MCNMSLVGGTWLLSSPWQEDLIPNKEGTMESLDFDKTFDTHMHKKHGTGPTGPIKRAITALKTPAWSLKTSLI